MKKTKILLLEGSFSDKHPTTYQKDSIGEDYEVTHFHYRKHYGFRTEPLFFWTWKTLDAHYKQGDPWLLETYAEIERLAKDHDVIYHWLGDMIHPDFIIDLSMRYGRKIFTIYNVDGEPASSDILSHPVVRGYDFALTCSKMYDNLRSCPQMLLAYGAAGADFVACGTKYSSEHPAWKIEIDKPRDIDVVFLGANMQYMESADGYPPNKYAAVKFLRGKGLKVHCEEWTGIDMAAELYARSKVGICLHGPSPYGVGNSQRLYDLTVCGVPVVTDGAGLGINEIYEPDEVKSYIWSNFEEMYQHVEYLLSHKKERIAMATKAREKTRLLYRNDYNDNWVSRGLSTAINFWKGKDLWTR